MSIRAQKIGIDFTDDAITSTAGSVFLSHLSHRLHLPSLLTEALSLKTRARGAPDAKGPGRFAADGAGPLPPRQTGSGERVQGPTVAPRPPPPSRSCVSCQPGVLHRRPDRSDASGGGAVPPASDRGAQARTASGHPGPDPLRGPSGATRPGGQPLILEVGVAPGLAGPRGRPLCLKKAFRRVSTEKNNPEKTSTENFKDKPITKPSKEDGENG